jgi:hopanoid biosynthesis associated protein HpnK
VQYAPPRLLGMTGLTPAAQTLVVTADDFGLAPEVNVAVETAHRAGILSAASLMVGAPACADAVERAKRLPGLAVGLHLVLVDGRPVLPPSRIPDLVGPDGAFRTGMVRLGAAMFFSLAVQRQVAAEIEAQFAAYAATGLPLDHVNAHKHFHLHPSVARLAMRIGRRYGVRGLRVPIEPVEVLAAIEPVRLGIEARVAAPFARLLRMGARRAGFVVPDAVFGLAWSGAMTAGRIEGLLRALPTGRVEIYTHPATRDGFGGAAPGYRYADELAALTAPEVIAALRETGLATGGYRDF